MYDIAIFGPDADKLASEGCTDYAALETDVKKEMRRLMDYRLAWGMDNRRHMFVVTTGIAGFAHAAFRGIETQRKKLEKKFLTLENRLYMPAGMWRTSVPGNGPFSGRAFGEILEKAYWHKETAEKATEYQAVKEIFRDNDIFIVYHLQPENGNPSQTDTLVMQEAIHLGERFYIMQYYTVKDGRVAISKNWPRKP